MGEKRALRRKRLVVVQCLPCLLVTFVACENLNGLGGDDTTTDGGKKPRDAASDATPPDGSTPNNPETGLPADGPRCDPTKSFGTPEIVNAFDGATSARSALLTPDELEAFYLHDKEVRHAVRSSRDASSPWMVDSVTSISPVPSSIFSLTVDGLKLYYAVLKTNPFSIEYYSVSRASRSAPFAMPKKIQVPELGFAADFFVLNSDDVVFFTKEVTPNGDVDKSVSTAMNGFGFTNAALTEHPGLIATGSDFGVASVTLNALGTVVYFNSDTEAVGKTKQWVSRRADKTVPFTQKAVEVTGLSDGITEGITWASNDDCEVMMNRSSHIYVARKPK